MPVMRRPAVEDDSVLDSMPEQWLKTLQRWMGGDDPASQVMLDPSLGMAKVPMRRVPHMGGGGARIPANSQAGVGTPEKNMAKIPRFRSEHGTFVKYEGKWWRVPEQPAGSVDVTLELLPPGLPEPGTVPKILERRTISASELVDDVRDAKGVREPTRMVKPKVK